VYDAIGNRIDDATPVWATREMNMPHTAEAAADSRVKVRRIVHTIHAVADIAACRARYLDMLGGLIFAEGYFEAEDRDMALP
jgi:hypothetical protein